MLLTAAFTFAHAAFGAAPSGWSDHLESDDQRFERAHTAFQEGRSALTYLLLQQVLARNPNHVKSKELLSSIAPPPLLPTASSHRRLWLAMELGHDSNISSASDMSSVHIPALNRTVDVKKPLYAIPSDFFGISGGGEAAMKISTHTRAFLSGIASARVNRNEIEFFPLHYAVSTGLTHQFGVTRWTLAGSLAERRLARYRLLVGRSLTGQVAFPTGTALETTLTLEWRDNLFPYFDQVRTQGLHYGLGFLHPASRSRLTLFSGEEASGGLEKSLDRKIHALDASTRMSGPLNSKIQLSAAWSQARYLERSPLFLVTRRDTTLLAAVELDYPINDAWHLTPRVIFEENRSNIPLTNFSRQQWSVTLRREF
ncbi:MAG: hypothetical protein Q8O31_03165 [Rhodocyclaceae bacterium]|nr:hypothetical protein [Rhodocyclaceae bacterium]